QEAIDALAEVSKLDPRITTVPVEVARLKLQMGNVESAIDYAQRALRVAPRDAPARLMLARGLMVHSEPARAEEILKKLVVEHDDSPAIHIEMARLELMQHHVAVARRNSHVR